MTDRTVLNYITDMLQNMPSEWAELTTHRLDVYNEQLAKTEFLEKFEKLYEESISETKALSELPTSYDYIRLGHPLSCVLEWTIARLNGLQPERVIGFSSRTAPILAVLRKNLLLKKNTRILYSGELPLDFDTETVQQVYGYSFSIDQVDSLNDLPVFDGSTVFISSESNLADLQISQSVDFLVHVDKRLGSIITVHGDENQNYISEIQHVRRRETIAMTPTNCITALKRLVGKSTSEEEMVSHPEAWKKVKDSINQITGTNTSPLLASSGLSMQYAIMMGLIDHGQQHHPGKEIKIVVPPNCYGGTNDQARRVAVCKTNVEIVDLHVDGDNDMVQSIDTVLDRIAFDDAIPFIIAEIPTNPRVEVPDLNKLKQVLGKLRHTKNGAVATDPVFILDQTFCPNVQFLKEGGVLEAIRSISYVSGSKFPSGGKCTAGYCVTNQKASALLEKIDKHLQLCDNEATDLQVEILSVQLPTMNERIVKAYHNTRAFVNFIKDTLPDAKINFVSEILAEQGFTPSVFSLDLPTKGDTDEERELYKRILNQKLINMMITEIPEESKHCVSYGQLKGCYWTIPATSTQGTTKESDKDYIARVSVSPHFDLGRHKQVFLEFVKHI